MSHPEIDKAILSVVEDRWLKVARIVGDVAKRLNLDWHRDKEQIDLVLERIQALVSEGRLFSQGDLSRPRYSEVRLPDAAE